MITNALMKMLSSSASIQTNSQPFPRTTPVNNDKVSFLLILLLGMGIVAIPGGFGINVVKTREVREIKLKPAINFFKYYCLYFML